MDDQASYRGTNAAQPEGVVRDLARQVVDWRPGPGAEALLLHMRVLLLDAVGCAVAARDHPVAAKAGSVAAHLFSGASATGLGSRHKLSPLGAVLDTGAAIRALDFNDFYWGPGIGGHPSDLFAVSLAMAEERDATLRAMLEATAIGYEIYIRLLDQFDMDGPFDHTTCNALAGAAITGRLMGLDAERMAHALALAGMCGPSLAAIRVGGISEAKAIAPAAMGVSGVLAAHLAAADVSGPVEAIEGAKGLGAVFFDSAAVGALGLHEGFPFRALDVQIKRFPCIGTAQAAVACALEIRSLAGARESSIRTMEIRIADNPVARHQTTDAYRRPLTRETADHSFYSLVALALVDGELTPTQFARRRFDDPDVHAMSDRLHFCCDLPGAREGAFPAQARALLENGASVAAAIDYAPGHQRNPLDRAGVVAKFRGCAEAFLGTRKTEDAISACFDSPWSTHVREFIATIV